MVFWGQEFVEVFEKVLLEDDDKYEEEANEFSQEDKLVVFGDLPFEIVQMGEDLSFDLFEVVLRHISYLRDQFNF